MHAAMMPSSDSVSGRGYSLEAFWKCEPRKSLSGSSAMARSKNARILSSASVIASVRSAQRRRYCSSRFSRYAMTRASFDPNRE